VEAAKVLLAAGANVHATEKVSEEYRWGMKLDYKDGVPYMRGGINEAGSHVPPPLQTHTSLACSRAEWLLMLAGK
jgi:hypothetical protein